MCALAVFLEQEGISTVVISLIRTHSEKIKPPRTLWVSFELGRPFGPPLQEDFQRRVLKSALALLEHSGPAPLHEDFPEDDPSAVADSDWIAPATADLDNINDELSLLDPHWHKARQRYGTTAVGLSGLPLHDAVKFLERLDSDKPMKLPDYASNDGISDVLRMRLCADDIRAFYSEAACSEGDPSSTQIWDWFWTQTNAAKLIYRIRENSIKSDHETRQKVGNLLLVPRTYR